MWDRVPPGIKPVVNRFVENYLGKSIDDLLADTQTIQTIAAAGGAALKGLAATAKTKTPGKLEPLDVERAMPLDARGNVIGER
jgi:ribosomal protein L12E/L44/L45/RPP1/RPP2